jgi:predicted ArsR family transcriptional regulator
MKIENDQYKGIGPLFDICASKHKGNPMSVRANKIASKGKATNRQSIMDQLEFIGPRTCQELEDSLKLSHQTCSARLSELRREGKIKIIGERKTRSGSPSSVYQAV